MVIDSIAECLFFPNIDCLDSHQLLFDTENDFDFLTKTNEPVAAAGPIHRRVSALFADAKPDGRYYEPQKITDETLMDVSCENDRENNLIDVFDCFRMNITRHCRNSSLFFN